MDLILDWRRASKFDCSTCDRKLANLRNCEGDERRKSKNHINKKVYPYCPRRPYIEDHESRHVVQLYMECRESRALPSLGSWSDQTAFAAEAFIMLDGMVSEWRSEEQQRLEEESKRASKRK